MKTAFAVVATIATVASVATVVIAAAMHLDFAEKLISGGER